MMRITERESLEKLLEATRKIIKPKPEEQGEEKSGQSKGQAGR